MIFTIFLALAGGVGTALQESNGLAPSALNIPEESHRSKDPLPKDKANLITGAGIYKENCAGCHGPLGTPVRKFGNLARQPATLTQGMLKEFSDGDLNWVLEHGAPGGMPSFADDLTETRRWQCVEFVRHLGKDAPKYIAAYEAAHPKAQR